MIAIDAKCIDVNKINQVFRHEVTGFEAQAVKRRNVCDHIAVLYLSKGDKPGLRAATYKIQVKGMEGLSFFFIFRVLHSTLSIHKPKKGRQRSAAQFVFAKCLIHYSSTFLFTENDDNGPHCRFGDASESSIRTSN